MLIGLSLDMSTLVYILIIATIVIFWRQIMNLIGGLIYLVLFVILAIFMLTTFTNINVGGVVDISEFEKLKAQKGDYLIEKKDDGFKKIGEVKESIDSLDEKEETNFKDETNDSSESNKKVKDLGKIKDDKKSNTNNKLKSESKIASSQSKEVELKYSEVPKFLKDNKLKLNKDEKRLIEGLSPHLPWNYKGERIEVENNKENIKIKVK